MDKIFGYLIARGDAAKDTKSLGYAMWFVDSFPSAEFSGDELMFWHFLDYCARLSVPAKQKYLDVWLSIDALKLMLSENIKVPGCETINFTDPVAVETAFRTTCDVLRDDFTTLLSMDIDVEDFPVDMSRFINTRKGERLVACMTKSFNIMNDTDDATKAAEYCSAELNMIELIYDETILEDLEDEVRYQVDDNLKITDWGLPAVDNDSHGIFGGQCVGIEAQPGAGKTRLAIGHLAYNAAVYNHKDVLYWSFEQDVGELKAMLIARHVHTLFNLTIADELIFHNLVPEDLKQYVEAARIDLFESGKYGKLVLLCEVPYVESFIKRLRTLNQLKGPFDLIIMDYMGLMESNATGYSSYSRDRYLIIADAYKYSKRYARKTKKGVVCVGQFNDNGIRAGEADKKILTDMAQGGIAVYRNTDYNIAISYTDEMEARQQRRISQPKKRSTVGFGTFMTNTLLGCCVYQQVASKEV